MPTLDSCIADLFEPGNIGSSSGTSHPPHYSGYLLAEKTVSASLSGNGQFTPSIDLGHYGAAGASGYTSFALLTISGTWVGTISVPFGNAIFQYTSNVSGVGVGQPGYSAAAAGFISGQYISGTAVVTLTSYDRIIIESGGSPLFNSFLKLD